MYFKPWRNARSFYYLRGMFFEVHVSYNTQYLSNKHIFPFIISMCICNYAPKVCKKFVFSIYISLKPNLFFRKTFVVIFLSDFEEIYIDFSRFDLHLLIYMYIKINFWPLIWKVNTSSTTLKYCFRSPLYILCKN